MSNQHVQQGHVHRSTAIPVPKEPFTALAIPAFNITPTGVRYGNAQSSSTRSFTILKAFGDGSFGTVWLCDWHGPLPPNTPMSAMQSVVGTRPEYANTRLVAVKRMRRKWEGGWDECRKLKELEALLAIPLHPNIIPLYDSFLLPDSKELYFVFEPMEGHLYQLIRSRRGRPFAGGLVTSIFRQIVHGLHHIHASGYFHRDMKPENILVTTTGHQTYPNLSSVAPSDAPSEQDVKVIVKLADFGLARETRSKPPYTEYVSTRWYRAPEVLLKSKDYSNPVDMWALGTILAELLNLRPLFPGKREDDQLFKITEVLGDPCENYGFDLRGKPFGGGRWDGGVQMAREKFGFTFQKIPPKDISSLFDRPVPPRLIECIADLLKYDPAARLTSLDCLEHPYFLEAADKLHAHIPPALSVSTSLSGHSTGLSTPVSQFTSSPRVVQPPPTHLSSHLAGIFGASSSHRQSFFPPADPADPQYAHLPHASGHKPHYPPPLQHSTTESSVSSYPSAEPSPNLQSDWESMQASSQVEVPEGYALAGQPMDTATSPMAQRFPSRPSAVPDAMHPARNGTSHDVSTSGSKLHKVPSLPFRKQRWAGLGGMFGNGDKSHLPPVDELHVVSQSEGSTPSLKRTQSSSTDSRSLPEVPPISAPPPPKDPKKVKKEAARMAREAEIQRRAQMKKAQQEQSRAVMQNRNQIIMESHTKQELEWKWQSHAHLVNSQDTSRLAGSEQKLRNGGGPIRDRPNHGNTAAGLGPYERMAKARKREFDDDHSMSSSDVRSSAMMSVMSFATNDSDPGPSSLRTRPSFFSSIREPPTSSPLGHLDDFSISGGASDQSLGHRFTQTSLESSSVSDLGSPPPIHALSLSPAGSWRTLHRVLTGVQQPRPSRLAVSSSQDGLPYGGHLNALSPSPGLSAPKSAINPIFKVPSRPSLKLSLKRSPSTPALPPFSRLDAIASGDCPPLSPMSFSTPDDDF
ncbi:kinase-like domain-containing protein [Multifurca ochricompacta]|uniref:Kinase-like domain-containing protein n=1 Tax=Multifurca ochricompacta TaxID=376703 RepID=A0AAD4MGT8_9AGAM|nr:kinase-like domain-containing protein [Multifurca ochricompacta]